MIGLLRFCLSSSSWCCVAVTVCSVFGRLYISTMRQMFSVRHPMTMPNTSVRNTLGCRHAKHCAYPAALSIFRNLAH